MTSPAIERAAPLREALHGALIPAVPVPFSRDGRVDERAQERYVEYLAGEPIAGVAVWAHTGRGLQLDRETAVAVLRSWRRGLPAKSIVAGAGALDEPGALGRAEADRAYAARARRMAELAAEHGADAVLAFAPGRFRGRELEERKDLIRSYHEEVARAGLPLIAFHLYEAAGGVSYTAPELRVILAMPQVAAIKVATLDSAMTYQDISRLIGREHPSTVLLTGEDRFLGYSLLRGASGALIGMGAACPGFQKRLVDLALEARAGRRERDSELIDLLIKADRLAECTFIRPLEGYIQRMLHALSVLGVIPESSTHDPWGPPISPAEKEGVARTLREIGEAG
jgi:4-hydroxy-tetrahydrodipicolinate synthase